MSRDYYDILGVSKNASQEDIKKAFRKKAHELHPDKGGDAEAFKAVNEAYQALSDEKKRAAYDRFGHAAFQGQAQGGGFGFTGGTGFGDFGGLNFDFEDLGDLGDVIGNMFGFGGRSGSAGRSTRRGRDVETTINVGFMDAVRGTRRPISLRVLRHCERCHGNGAEPGTKLVSCADCRGAGKVTQAQRTPFGVFQSVRTCESCHGSGKTAERVCGVCRGSGVSAQNRALDVEIPAGIADGETIKLVGQGEAAPTAVGGASGDLYVHVRVASHPKFKRAGHDIASEEFAPLSIFLLGGKIAVATAHGDMELAVPAGTCPGAIFRLRGQGIPFIRSRSRGDHLVTLQADIPKKLSKEQKRLIDELKRQGL